MHVRYYAESLIAHTIYGRGTHNRSRKSLCVEFGEVQHDAIFFPVYEYRNQENYDVIFGIAVPYNDIIMNFWRQMLAWMYYR